MWSLAGAALQAGLCLLLLVRRSYRQFPIFFTSTVFSVCATLVLLSMRSDLALYSKVFWTSETISVFLAFFALQEAFRSVFRNFLGMRWFGWVFPGIGFSMVALALLRTILVPRPAQSLLLTTIINLEIGVGFLQFGICSAFIILIGIFHVRWLPHAIGIVLGFGIGAAGLLVAYLLRSEFGTKFDPIVRNAPAIAYIIGVVVWLVAFWKREAPSKPEWTLPVTPEQAISELRQYTRAVKGIFR